MLEDCLYKRPMLTPVMVLDKDPDISNKIVDLRNKFLHIYPEVEVLDSEKVYHNSIVIASVISIDLLKLTEDNILITYAFDETPYTLSKHHITNVYSETEELEFAVLRYMRPQFA